ncbi:MAG: hypothetical protein HC859_08770 [Bacteroidia bacterium]|nr:hypothetical protein [Bacteroidia bacterium]
MKRIRFKKKGWTKSFYINKLIDLMIVVVGVTVAFQLNNLKERSDQRNLERFYLEGILADLGKDMDAYNNILKSLESDQRMATGALDRLADAQYVNDSLGSALVSIMSLNTFRSNSSTYTTLLNGNGMSAIRNTEIRNLISDHYDQYRPIYRFESVYTEVLLKLFDYASAYCDFTTAKIVDSTIGDRVQTKNMLLVVRAQLDDGIGQYNRSLEKANDLTSSIRAYLRE